jgi:hypothetical protein
VSRYSFELVFIGEEYPSYVGGLYALHDLESPLNVYMTFVTWSRDISNLKTYFEQNRVAITTIGLDKDDFCQEIMAQINQSVKVLRKAAQEGRLIGSSFCGRFVNIKDSSKSKTQNFERSGLQKFRACPVAFETSFVRYYGIQFGIDIVLITGSCLKITQKNSQDQNVMIKAAIDLELVLNQSGITPNWFQGHETQPLDLDEED